MGFGEKWRHRRSDLRTALKEAEEDGSRLASISEIVNKIPPEISGALGPICSGTIIAFRLQKRGPMSLISREFYDENTPRTRLVFEIPGKNHQQGTLYIMPPGTYSVKQTKLSIRFTPLNDFKPNFEFIDYKNRRFYVLTTDKENEDEIAGIDKQDLGVHYAGPVLLENAGKNFNLRLFSKTLSPTEKYNFFIEKK